VLSTKPYLIRALWQWCCDAGLTPYLTVFVDEHCSVPLDYVQDGSITLNLSPSATGKLDIGNEWITLSARFGGVPRELFIPIGAVVGIFARENGAGMEFAYETTAALTPAQSNVEIKPALAAVDVKPDNSGKPARPPHLQRIK
jgi:stringent starvation protein B